MKELLETSGDAPTWECYRPQNDLFNINIRAKKYKRLTANMTKMMGAVKALNDEHPEKLLGDSNHHLIKRLTWIMLYFNSVMSRFAFWVETMSKMESTVDPKGKVREDPLVENVVNPMLKQRDLQPRTFRCIER